MSDQDFSGFPETERQLTIEPVVSDAPPTSPVSEPLAAADVTATEPAAPPLPA
jgi:hypothetical protein